MTCPETDANEYVLCIRLIGDMNLTRGNGDTLPCGARKAKALLALIALSPNYSVSRTQAAFLLWSDHDRRGALARLRDLLHVLKVELQQVYAQAILSTHHTISFKPEAVWIDVSDRILSNAPRAPNPEQLLADLESVDPAFDRWLARVRENLGRSQGAGSITNSSDPSSSLSRPRRQPRIAITKFEANLLDQSEHLAEDFAETIGMTLVGFRWIGVVMQDQCGVRLSRGGANLEKLAEYALVGIIRQADCACRLSLQLVDLERGHIVAWSSTLDFDRYLKDLKKKAIAQKISASLEAELITIEAARDENQRLRCRDRAYTAVLEAIPAMMRLERSSFLAAGRALEEAVGADPNFAMAHSWLAYWNVLYMGQGLAVSPAQTMTRAAQAAERAIVLDPKDARGYSVAGHVKAFLYKKYDDAVVLHDLAVEANPALASAWYLAGMTQLYKGESDEASRRLAVALELAPDSPQAFLFESGLALVALVRGEYDEAVRLAFVGTKRQPLFTASYKACLAALGHLGKTAEAKIVLQRLLQIEPRFSIRQFTKMAPYQQRKHLEIFVVGLRKAGVA